MNTNRLREIEEECEKIVGVYDEAKRSIGAEAATKMIDKSIREVAAHRSVGDRVMAEVAIEVAAALERVARTSLGFGAEPEEIAVSTLRGLILHLATMSASMAGRREKLDDLVVDFTEAVAKVFK